MDDSQLLQQIESLVNEEHELDGLAGRGGLDAEQHARMQELEVRLDQLWDLLRQRRARRNAGLNPDEAAMRNENVVEHYQQ